MLEKVRESLPPVAAVCSGGSVKYLSTQKTLEVSVRRETTRIARIVLGLILVLMAANVFGQKVTTDSVPGTDWSKYHSYAWGEGTPAQDPLVAQKIVAGIDAQLAAKGLKKVDSDPDLVVIYHTATDQQKSLNWSSMGGCGRFGGMGRRRSTRLSPGS